MPKEWEPRDTFEYDSNSFQEINRRNHIPNNKPKVEPEKDLWGKTKDIASDVFDAALTPIEMVFGATDEYKKSKKQYESIFTDKNIIDFDYTDNNPTVKHFNKKLLEERFVQEADKLIPEDQKDYKAQLLRRTFDRTERGAGGGAIGDKDDGIMSRLSELLVRELSFDGETSESLSSLIDTFLEVETAAETMLDVQKQRKRSLQGDDEEINPIAQKTLGKFLEGAAGDVLGATIGLNDQDQTKVNNFLFNTGKALTNLNPFGDMEDYNFRPLDYVTWAQTKEQIDKLSAMKIASMPEDTPEQKEAKIKASEEHQAAIADPKNAGDGYWESTIQAGAHLLGSMVSPIGEFSIAMKGANAVVKGIKSPAKYLVHNKMAKVSNIFRERSKDIVDLTKIVQENPRLMAMGGLIAKGLNGKNLAYEGAIIPSLKSFMGRGVENAARMTIAAGLVNSIDLGMDEEEAWEATKSMAMLSVGNEYISRMIGRVARGMKLYNGIASKYATNPQGLAKSVENWYYTSYTAGQALSQGIVNNAHGIDIFKKKENGDLEFNEVWLGEMITNTIFSGKELYANIRYMKNRKNIDRPDFENENLFNKQEVTEDNIHIIRPDEKIFLESIKSKEGQIETKAFIAPQTNTPASYITREAKSRNLDLTNLKLRDVYDMTQEQHKLQDSRTADFVTRVMELAGDTPVRLQDIGESSKAIYKADDDAIYFNDNTKASGSGYEDVYRIMVEEGLHKISVDRYKNDKEFADKTNRFLEKAREATGYGTENFANDLDPITEQLLAYHLDNPHEFLALLLNPRLKTAKEHIFSKLSSQDPTKGLRGILRRFISKDKAQEKEFDTLLNDMLYSTKAESVENNEVASVGEFETTNSIETMPDEVKAPTEPTIDPDLDLLFNDDYGSVITNKNAVKNDVDINSKIEEFNRVAVEQGLNKPKTINDFMNDAFVEYGGEYTKQELNDVIAKKTEQVSTFKADIAKIEETLNKITLDENKADDYEVASDKINIKDIFKAHDANLVLNKYAGKPFDNIKTDVHKSLAKNYTDLSPNQVDLLSDFVSNQLSRTKEYKTLSLIEGRLVNNAAHSFNNKNLRYFDGEATGYDQWKEHFTNNVSNQEYFMPDAKELINNIFSKDMNAIMFGYETVQGKGSEKAVSTYLEEILSDDVKYDKFIKENLSRGLYLVPRGPKNLSVISSKKLGEIASSPKKSLKLAKQLHKGNFYHWLDSDATWGYSADRPNFNQFAKMIKHEQLHSWAKGDTKKAIDLAFSPEYVETLRENRELLEVLRNKAKEYYTDAEGRFLEIDHLFDEKKSLIALDDEITSTFMWGLDPAGDGRTIKFSADRSEARVKKLATKYEGVEFGRNASQLATEALIRKHLPDYDHNTALTESDLKSIYNELGIKYHNGELYQRTIVIDPNMLEGTLAKIFSEMGTDGATFLKKQLSRTYNSMMFNPENSAVTKPKYYGLDNNGNILIYKTGSFNLNFDKISEQSNSLADAYKKNLFKSVGAITFDTSMKSGHTRKISRVPASTNPDGYVIVNAVKKPIGAEVNGKRDNDLFKAELELYKQNLNNGIVEDKYILDIPLTGKNPLQLIGASHSADAKDAGSWGIPDNPLHNLQNPFWQKDSGKAYEITQRLIGNVIDKNVGIMESLISLRNDLGEALNTNSPDLLKKQGIALKALANELIHSDNTEEAYDFISNIGVDNFRSIIESAIDGNGAVKKEYLLSLLAVDRLIAGQAGAAPGASSLLFNASKRAFDNASKVRVSGTKATVIPDLQSNADMVRLINYEAEQATNIDTIDKIKSRGMEYIVEMIDPETGLYKSYSQGNSLGYDIIKKYNLKMGQKIFLKLTPNDDLHSMVPVIVTGMSSTEGTVAMNQDYLTEIMSRDFDKDDLQIMIGGEDISKEDFEYLWDFYTKEGMHTGILKDGNEELKKSANIISNNQRLINEKFAYQKKATLPQETGFGKTARQSHIGQAAGIGLKKQMAAALKNINWEKGEDGNYYEQRFTIDPKTNEKVKLHPFFKYPSDPKVASELSELVQKFFDTYDYAPYNVKYEFLKLFIDNIDLHLKDFKTGEKYVKTYKFNEIPSNLKKTAVQQATTLVNRYSGSGINQIGKSKNLGEVKFTLSKAKSGGESVHDLLSSRLISKQLEDRINPDAEILRDKLIQDQATAIKSKANEYYNKYPEVYTPLNNIAGELISRTQNLNSLISSSSPAKLAFAYKKMDTFGMNKKKTYLKAAQGVLFNDMANKYRHNPESQLIARIGEKDVVYKHNGIEGSIEYNNQKVPLKDLFNEEGVLSIPELELDADLLNNRIALLIEGKGYTDSEKGNLLGRMAGVVTKNVLPILNKKGYDISEGEAVSILGFSEYSGTSFLLPSLKGSNAIPGGRTMEISNVEKGIRDAGLIPLVDGLPPQQYAFNHTFEYAKSLYTGKNEELRTSVPSKELEQTSDFTQKNIFTVEPIKSVDVKAKPKAKIATQYIGFADGIEGSSTALYAKQAGEYANSGNYSSNDVIFVSVGGKRGNETLRKQQQDKTIAEAIKALETGATLITDNAAYVESNPYNEGEKRLAANLKAKNYKYSEITVDNHLLGVWNKTNNIEESKITFDFANNKIETSNTLQDFLKAAFNESNSEDYIDPIAKKLTNKDKEILAKAVNRKYKDINQFDWESIWGNVNEEQIYYYLKTGNLLNQDVQKDLANSKLYKDYREFIKDNQPFITNFYTLPKEIQQQLQKDFDKIETKDEWYQSQLNDLRKITTKNLVNKPEELGSPIIAYDRKAGKETRSIYKDIAKHLGVSKKQLNVNKISNQEWNGVVDKILEPMLKKSVNKSKLFKDQATRDRFIESEMNALSAGSIDNTLETLIARDDRAIKNTESYHSTDANGDYIISDSQKFVRNTMKSQYLIDYMDMLSDLKNDPSKSGYVNYKLFNSNTKEVIINENALNRKVYNFDEKLFPTNAYENGELVLTTDETGMKVPMKKYSVMGDLVDKKLASNQTHKMYSKHWVEQILPTKRQVLNTDMIKAFLSDQDAKLFQGADNIESIDRLSSLRNQEYMPVLDKLLSQVQFNRKFDITHKDGKIIYTREAIEGMSKQSVSGNIEDVADIIQAMKTDFIDSYVSPTIIDMSDADKIKMFEDQIAPQLNDYLKSKMVFKHTSDYLRNVRDNAEFIADNRVTDIASKKMLKQEVEKVNDMIQRLEGMSPKEIAEINDLKLAITTESNPEIKELQEQKLNAKLKEITSRDFNTLRTLTRKFKISDEAVLIRLEDYFTRPREAAEEKYNSLKKDVNPFYEVEGAGGQLKTAFTRALLSGKDLSPEQALEMIPTSNVGTTGLTIKDMLEGYDHTKYKRADGSDREPLPHRDWIKVATDMKELVRMAYNDMGDWYNEFRKLGYEGYEKKWEELDQYEKKAISDKTISTMKGVFNSYKNSLKTTAKVKALWGTQTPSLKTKEFTALEDLFAVTIKDSENRDMFSYSMKNFEEKMEKIARTTSYAIQKAMNVEYLKDPETNKVLEPIILGEFTSAMGGKFQYNTSYDIGMLGKLSSLTMDEKSVGIREGKPTFAMYTGRDGETKQLVGRFLNTYKKALYNADGSLKSEVPYITIVDDLSMNSRIYTMPISSISNLVTGEATYGLMRKHDLHQQGYYAKLSKTITPELKAMTNQYLNDKGNIETSPMIDKAESNISREVSNLKEDLKSNSIHSLTDKGLSVASKVRVATTYGFGGVAFGAILGTGAAMLHPPMAIGILSIAAAKVALKYTKVYIGNIFGNTAGIQAIGYSDRTNPLARGASIFKSGIKLSKDVGFKNKDEYKNLKTDIADASTKALDAARDNQSEFGYLVGEAKAKEAQKNIRKDYLYNKQTQKNKEAMELIENHVRNKYADNEADIELVRAGDKLMNKIISKVEKSGSKVTIQGNNVFIDGKSVKEFDKFQYKLIDFAVDWSMLKGRFATWEKESYHNALVVGEAHLQQGFQKYFREYEDKKTAPMDANLVFNALLLHKVNSIGDYDKTPSQRSSMGKLFSLYTAFGKESFLNQTVYRAKREQRMQIAQEIYANNQEFQDWYKKKNGVPFLDLTMRSGKQDFIAQALFEGIGGAILGILYDLTDISDLLGFEGANNLDYAYKNALEYGLHLFGVQQVIMDASTTAIAAAMSLMVEPTHSSKLGKEAIVGGGKVFGAGSGGGFQNEIITTFWELGALTSYGLYAEEKGGKYKKAFENTLEDRVTHKATDAVEYIIPGSRDLIKEMVKPKKRKR